MCLGAQRSAQQSRLPLQAPSVRTYTDGIKIFYFREAMLARVSRSSDAADSPYHTTLHQVIPNFQHGEPQ